MLSLMMKMISLDFQLTFQRFCVINGLQQVITTVSLFAMALVIGFPILFLCSWMYTPSVCIFLWIVIQWSFQDCLSNVDKLQTVKKRLFPVIQTIFIYYGLFCVYPWIVLWYESIPASDSKMQLLCLSFFPMLRFIGIRIVFYVLKADASDIMNVLIIFGIKLIYSLYTSVVLLTDPNPFITIFLICADIVDILFVLLRLIRHDKSQRQILKDVVPIKKTRKKHAAFIFEFCVLSEYVEVIIP